MNRKDPRFVLGLLIAIFFVALALSFVTIQVYGGYCNGSSCLTITGNQSSYTVTTLHYVTVHNNGGTIVYAVEQSTSYHCQSFGATTLVFHDGRTTVLKIPYSCLAPEYDS